MITRTIIQAIAFQSTPPARGATLVPFAFRKFYVISIHAPREGGDCILWPLCLPVWEFQSTPPARGATLVVIF